VRALLTGASSFTGAWFARALAADGWEVAAALRGPDRRDGSPRGLRLAFAAGACRLVVPEAPFGSPAFLALLAGEGPFDLLCHHGAEVGDFRRPGYDADAAVAAGTRGLEAVLDAMGAAGCGALLVTGTVFEADEGEGDPPLRAFNAYGLAKTLAWHRFRYAAERRGLGLGKLVVPSPFGPLEKEGFTADLMRAWVRGEAALVRRPRLVRDHVPVPFLAAAYARLARLLPGRGGGTVRASPSGLPLPLDGFARRLAAAMRPRLGGGCRFTTAHPPEPTDEPLVRRNLEPVPELGDPAALGAFWDAYAAHWLQRGREG
jgi:UDP-glucose 4-epimerase